MKLLTTALMCALSYCACAQKTIVTSKCGCETKIKNVSQKWEHIKKGNLEIIYNGRNYYAVDWKSFKITDNYGEFDFTAYSDNRDEVVLKFTDVTDNVIRIKLSNNEYAGHEVMN